MNVSFESVSARVPSRLWPGRRAHLPLRVAPMLLVGMILLVLGVLSTAAF
ncbi:hypothetical protein [Salarchaeum japonicum]|nr:hypothetical protein [Salarchaeum japonicum]